MATARTPARWLRPLLFWLLALAGLTATGGPVAPVADQYTLPRTGYRIEVWRGDSATPVALRHPQHGERFPFNTPGAPAHDVDLDGNGQYDASLHVGATADSPFPKIDVKRLEPRSDYPMQVAHPDVRLAVVFDIHLNGDPWKQIKAGYDLRKRGATMPPLFRATLHTVVPLDLSVTTQPDVPLVSTLLPKPTYAGPLGVYGHVTDAETGATTELDLEYRPLPDSIRVNLTDVAGLKTVEYGHGRLLAGTTTPDGLEPVDLHATIRTTEPDSNQRAAAETTIVSRIRDLPSSLRATVKTDSRREQYSTGAITYVSPGLLGVDPLAAGPARKPSITARLVSRTNWSPAGDPRRLDSVSDVTARVDELANRFSADWYLPDDRGCVAVPKEVGGDHPCKPRFTARAALPPLLPDDPEPAIPDSAAIGSVEFDAESYLAEVAPGEQPRPKPVPDRFVAGQRNYFSFSKNTHGSTRVTGRIGRLRRAHYHGEPHTHVARLDAGASDQTMQVHLDIDGRTAEAHPDRSLTRVNTVVHDLPRDVSMTFRSQHDSTPMLLHVTHPAGGTSPTQYDVDADVYVAKTAAGSADGPALCATTGISCARVRAQNLGSSLQTTLFDDATRTSVDFAHVPVAGEATQVRANVAAFVNGAPLLADVDVTGLPENLAVRVRKNGDKPPTSVSVDACRYELDAQRNERCAEGSAGEVADVAFEVRNVKDDTALPVIRPETEDYVTLASRGRDGSTDSDYRASGRLREVKGLQFSDNERVQGLHARLGGGKRFSVVLRAANALKDATKPEDGRMDVTSAITIPTLPTDFQMCVKLAGKAALGLPKPAYTVPCETATPAKNLAARDAIAFGYHANARFGVTGTVRTHEHKTGERVAARMAIEGAGVPEDFKLWLVTPTEKPVKRTQVRAVLDTLRADGTPSPGELPDVRLSAQVTTGDATCEDPRTTATATCVATTLHNLPHRVDVHVDPKNTLDTACGAALHLCIHVEGDPGQPAKLAPFTMSMVRPAVDDTTEQVIEGRSDVLVVESAEIVVPTRSRTDGGARLTGMLRFDAEDSLPPSIAFTAEPKLDLDVGVKSFVGERDDLKAPAKRTITLADGSTVTDTAPELALVHRGGAGSARVKLAGLRHVELSGMEPAPPAQAPPPGAPAQPPLPTKVVRASFDSERPYLRVYVDLFRDEELAGGLHAPGDDTLLDVVLTPLPKSVTLCVRPKADPRAASGGGTWCDRPNGAVRVPELRHEGTFQVATEASAPIDLDAFVRLESSDHSLLAGRVRLDDVAPLVRVRFPLSRGGDLAINGYRPTTGTPTADELAAPTGVALTKVPVGTVSILAKSHDLPVERTPYTAETLPYVPVPGTPATDLPGTGSQRLGMLTGDGALALDLEVRHLEELLVAGTDDLGRDCARPAGIPARGDDPHYPPYVAAEDAAPYLCVTGTFATPAGERNPLALHLAHDDGVEHLSLRGLTLNHIPSAFQVRLAKVDTMFPDESFRPSCGTVDNPGPAGCVPPLLNVAYARDAAAGDLEIEGGIGFGASEHVRRLASLDLAPAGLANLQVDPADGWGEWGADPRGIRARVGLVTVDGELMPSVVAGLRVAVPVSFTLDQVKKWTRTEPAVPPGGPFPLPGSVATAKATDIDLAYRLVRRPDDTRTSIGRLSAVVLLADHKRGTAAAEAPPEEEEPGGPVQKPPRHRRRDVDVPAPASVTVVDRTENLLVVGGIDDAARSGLPAPDRLDTRIYLRSNMLTGQDFVQVEGSASHPIDARVRALQVPGAKSALGPMDLDATLLDLPGAPAADAAPGDPAYRIVAELASNPAEQPCTDVCAKAKLKITATIDLDPKNNGSFARRVEAVVVGYKSHNGIEVEGFESVDPANLTQAPVTVRADVVVDPLEIAVRKDYGVNVDFDVDIGLRTTLDATHNRNFAVRHDTAELEIANLGDPRQDLPVELKGTRVHARTMSGEVRLGVPIAWFHTPDLPKDLPFEWQDCRSDFRQDRLSPIVVPPGTVRTLLPNAAKNSDITVVTYVPNVPAVATAILATLGSGEIFSYLLCDDAHNRFPLIHESGHANSARTGHPAVPVAMQYPGHTVPGARYATAVPPRNDVRPRDAADLTVAPGEPLRLCGLHMYDELVVPAGASIETATVVDPRRTNGDGLPNCPHGQGGRLVLLTRRTTVEPGGRVSADFRGLDPGSAVGNGGGSHVRLGGRGSAGFGLPSGPRGSDDPWLRETEPGTAGGHVGELTGGAGGGSVVVFADQAITVAGEVSARGAPGPDGCGESTYGGGGGAGGGIVLDAPDVTVSGAVVADGGNGGNGRVPGTTELRHGGGGGGAAGTVKVFRAHGTVGGVSLVGGAGGATCDRPAERRSDGGGGAGLSEVRQTLRSRAVAAKRFWSNGSFVDVGYDAAVPDGGDVDYWVVVCGARRSAASMAGWPADKPLVLAFDRPNWYGNEFPCGGGGEIVGYQKTRGATQTYDPETGTPSVRVDIGPGQQGYWGFWTRLVIPPAGREPTDCFVVPCRFEQVQRGLADAVYGVDRADPSVDVVSPKEGFVTSSERLPLEIRSGDLPMESGVAKVECSFFRDEPFEPCPQVWDLARSGTPKRVGDKVVGVEDGTMTLRVRVTDGAGNSALTTRRVVLDTTPSGVTGSVVGVTRNGWHVGRVAVVVTRQDGGTLPPPGDPAYVYKIDGGRERPCNEEPCVVELDGLKTGAHRVQFTAYDAAGNRHDLDDDACVTERCVVVPIDRAAPVIVPVPVLEEGDNGWSTTAALSLVTLDQVGGSGPGTASYALKDGDGNLGAFVRYDEQNPPVLSGVVKGVCVRGTDAAGNAYPGDGQSVCTDLDVKADAVAPALDVRLTGPRHDDGDVFGTGTPAFTGAVTPAIDRSDALSGLSNGVSVDTLCDAVPPPPTEGRARPAGVCVARDGGAFQPITAEGALAAFHDGWHEIAAYAVDVAGNRSPIVRRTFVVDSSAPGAAHAVVPFAADDVGAARYRVPPVVSLRAPDGFGSLGSGRDGLDGSGTARIEYRFGGTGTWETYAGPVALPPGAAALRYRAVDRLGNVSAEVVTPELVSDVADPSASVTHDVTGMTPTFRVTVSDLLVPGGGDRPAVGHAADVTLRGTLLVFDANHGLLARQAFTVTAPAGGGQATRTLTQPVPVTARAAYARVVVADPAGNWYESTESRVS